MHTLNVCTIYPDKVSIYTELNEILLNTIIGDKVKLVYRYIKAGHFNKGIKDDTKQMIARKQYLEGSGIGEFLLILDSDEQLCGSIELIPDLLTMMKTTNKQVAHISEIRGDLKMYSRPRILYQNEPLVYDIKIHDRMYNIDLDNILDKDYKHIIKAYPIQFSHHTKTEYTLV